MSTMHMLWIVIMCVHVLAVQGKPSGVQDGPCVGMDCLHGVLMHNDNEQGGEHKAEDQYLRFKSQLETGKTQAGPEDAETQLHGVLMHDGAEQDSSYGHGHAETLPQQVPKAGPQDLNEMVHKGMHGGETVHKHSWDESADDSGATEKGPINGDKLMHGILMHGDANHEHNDESNEESGSAGGIPRKVPSPMDADTYMHGVLMHGDAADSHPHGHSTDGATGDQTKPAAGPDGNMLHGILMHGDSGIGHDHSDEDANTQGEVFRDLSKIREIIQDEALLKIIDIDKILQKDMEEYKEWVDKNPISEDAGLLGSTNIEVSDTILNDIALMKQKYLSERNIEKEDTLNMASDFKNIPFSADDANNVVQGHAHAHDEEGIGHDLELLGSTEPLNARHKVKLEVKRSKDEH